jgi:hypothetical protein
MARKVLFVGLGLLRDEQLLWALYLLSTCVALLLQAVFEPYQHGPANHMEASFLLVQAVTLALGGVFTFELVETSSLLGKLISVVLILINFYTLLPLLVSLPCTGFERAHNVTDIVLVVGRKQAASITHTTCLVCALRPTEARARPFARTQHPIPQRHSNGMREMRWQPRQRGRRRGCSLASRCRVSPPNECGRTFRKFWVN